MTRRLVLFAKPPLAGLAKTRLAETLGAEAAAALAEAMLADTFQLCEKVGESAGDSECRLVLAYATGRQWFTDHLSPSWRLIEQGPGDLDDRLERVLRALQPDPQDATAFIGMDAPHLPVGHLRQAFAELESASAVLGPCTDGGYYLLGVRGALPAGVLAGVRWSTDHALADTSAALLAAGLTCALLPECYDLDTVAELRALAAELPRLPADSLCHLRRALAGVDLLGEGDS